jgi:hypothetical protein
MHKNHLIGCGAGIAIALAFVALSGGSAGGLGILAAALFCPIVMIGVMYFLIGSTHPSHTADRPVDERTTSPS